MNVWIFLCVLMGYAGSCLGNLCHPEELKSCLQPSVFYLSNVSTIYGRPAGILQTTIDYFYVAHFQENTYHIRSFQTIMVKLDEVFYRRSKLEKGCKIFTKAENCLLMKKQWCDQEARGILEGIENVFNFICHPKYMKVFKDNEECIIGKASEGARLNCNKALNKALHVIGETITKFPDKWYNKGKNTQDEEVVQTCRSVKEALSCYQNSIKSLCGDATGKWEYRLRHALVQLLLTDICGEQSDYEYIDSLTSEECFVCKDGEKCLPAYMKCDGVKNCADGSDETSYLCGQHWDILDTILLTGAIIAVIATITICIIKYKENIKYSLKHRLQWRTTEMQVFINEINEEDEEGDEEEATTQNNNTPSISSPPQIKTHQSRPFQYEQLTSADDELHIVHEHHKDDDEDDVDDFNV